MRVVESDLKVCAPSHHILAAVPLIFLGTDRTGLVVLIPALLVSFFGHVAYMVTGTSGLPDEEQGLATGLTTMTQNVAITIGIPILSAIAATQTSELSGIHLALTVTLASIALIWIGLPPRTEQSASPVPVANEAYDHHRVGCHPLRHTRPPLRNHPAHRHHQHLAPHPHPNHFLNTA